MNLDDATGSESSLSTTSDRHLLHIYEISSAMEGLYAYLAHHSEQWKAYTISWIFSLFKSYFTYPLQHPKQLSIIIQILIRENLLTSVYISTHMRENFDQMLTSSSNNTSMQLLCPAFHNFRSYFTSSTFASNSSSSSAPSSSTQEFEYFYQMMNRISMTLHFIIGDLLPIFPPSEQCSYNYHLLLFYHEKVYEKIRDDLMTYYYINKVTFSKIQLFMLLTFLNHQYSLLSR
jgi:hypothetical protein